MIRELDDLVLLKEINDIDGINYTGEDLRKKYPSKIVVIRHLAYIKKDVLCEVVKQKVTDLSDYLPLGELAEQISVNNNIFRERIYFMKQTGTKLFEYINLGGIYFIKVDNEFKNLLQNYQPFLASFSDKDNIVHCRLLGDLKIGFY